MRIPLHDRSGGVLALVVIDDDDRRLAKWSWHLSPQGYAARTEHGPFRRTVLMHREIMCLGDFDPLQVDHINRDKLDNRRANLRVVTIQQQRQNVGAHRDSRSGRRGVSWHEARGKWRAEAQVDGRRAFLGYFDDVDEAAAAAAEWRAEHMPFAEVVA